MIFACYQQEQNWRNTLWAYMTGVMRGGDVGQRAGMVFGFAGGHYHDDRYRCFTTETGGAERMIICNSIIDTPYSFVD